MGLLPRAARSRTAPLALAAALALPLVPAAETTSGPAQDEAMAHPDACTAKAVVISSETGVHAFEVELALSAQEQARGLMFRASLAPEAGMLFIYPNPRTASFWMKNTMIALDMLFVDDTGVVVNIAERTTPYSLEPQRSDAPVRAVLEINGGLSERLGIGPGAQVIHPAFRQAPKTRRCPALAGLPGNG